MAGAAAPRGGWWRIARVARRWIVRIVIAALALIVCAIVAVVIALRTDWGRERVRRIAEAQLEGVLGGPATIGRLDGDVFGELVAHDVVIEGPPGRGSRIRIPTVRVDVALWPLLDKQVRVEHLIVEDAEVVWRGGAPPPKPSSGGPSAWVIDLRDVEIERAQVAVDAGAKRIAVDVDTLRGAARLADGEVSAHAAAQVSWARGGVPGLATEGDAAIDARVTPGRPIDATVRATVAGARIVAIAQVDPAARKLSGVIASRRVALGSPALIVNGLARFAVEAPDGGGAWLDRAGGSLTGVGGATLSGVPVRGAVVTATLTGPSVHVEATAIGDGGARVAADADLSWRGDGVWLDHARARAVVDAPGTASGDQVALGGRVTVELERADGPLWPVRSLALAAHLDAEGPAYGDLGARTLHATLDARGLLGATAGPPAMTVTADATGARRGDLAIGPLTLTARPIDGGRYAVRVRSQPRAAWTLDADATVAPGETTRIELGHHQIGARGQPWTGDGGAIEIGPLRVTVRGVRSAGPRGALAIDEVTYERDGPAAGTLIATGAATGLDVAALARLLGADPAWRGGLDAKVRVARRGGRWSGVVAATGRGLARDADAPSIDGHVDLRLGARALELHATAAAGAGGADGTAAIDVALTPPARLNDLAAWRRLDRAALTSVRVRAGHLDLAAASRIARASGASGRLDGDVTIGATDARGELHLRVAAIAILPGSHELDADLAITAGDRGAITASGTGALAGVAVIDAAATVVAPARPLDPAAWRALGAGALVGASARVDDVAVDPALLARLGVTLPYRGRVGATIDVGPALAVARGRIELRGVTGGAIVRPIDVDLEGHVDGSGAGVSVAGRSGGRTLFGATATAPIRMADVLAAGGATSRATPLVGRVEIAAVPLDVALAVIGREDARGTLSATVDLGGTLGAPTAIATVSARDVRGGGDPRAATMGALDLTARWKDRTLELDATATETGGGRLHATAHGDVGALATLELALDATRFELAPLAQLGPGRLAGAGGVLDAELAQRGLDPERGDLHGHLRLARGSLPLSPAIGTLRDAELTATIARGDVAIALDAHLGGGTIAVHGSASLATGAATRARGTIVLHGVSPIGMHEPSIDGTVDAELLRVGGRWRAELDARGGKVTLPARSGHALHPVGAPDDMVFGDARAPTAPRPRAAPAHRGPRDPDLVATLRLGPTEVVSPEAHGVIHGALVISIGEDAVGVTGGIDTDRADVDLLGRRYQVERGAAQFDGSTDPLLDVVLGTKLTDLTLHAVVTGRSSDPQIRLTSDPAIYTEDQLFGFLLGAEPGGATGDAARDAARGATSAVASNLVGGVINELLPGGVNLDVLRYQAATSSSSAAVTIGKWLGHSLFLGVSHHIEPHAIENEYEGDIEWWFGRDWLFHVTAGDGQVDNADVSHRWRW